MEQGNSCCKIVGIVRGRREFVVGYFKQLTLRSYYITGAKGLQDMTYDFF